MFKWLDNAWHAVTGSVDSTISRWVHDVVRGLWSFLFTIFGDVGHAWDDLVKDASFYIGEVDGFAVSAGTKLFDVYRWINRYGAQLVSWIEHPDKLVSFIFDSLLGRIESEAWSVAGRLGKFFLALILRNLNTFIHTVEDILDAVL